QNSCIQMDAPL
ncbi:hypothetical protein E2320_007987, partial [Naja naja]